MTQFGMVLSSSSMVIASISDNWVQYYLKIRGFCKCSLRLQESVHSQDLFPFELKFGMAVKRNSLLVCQALADHNRKESPVEVPTVLLSVIPGKQRLQK